MNDFIATPETDAQGIDLIAEFLQEHMELMRAHQNEGAPHPGGCESIWRSTGDVIDEQGWECSRQPQHAGLHASLVNLTVYQEETQSLYLSPVVAAIWGEPGTVIPR